MRAPLSPGDFETFHDGGLTLHVGKEVLAGHVGSGRVLFYFGMFGDCRLDVILEQ